jgi:hypothetical protein
MNLNDVLETKGKDILFEASELFNDNIKALSIAVNSFDNSNTSTKIYNDLIVSKITGYEVALRKITELKHREILAFKELAKIDYNQCRVTLQASAEYLRFKDFKIEPQQARIEVKNLESIIEHAKALHSLLSKIRGTQSKYHKCTQRTLF